MAKYYKFKAGLHFSTYVKTITILTENDIVELIENRADYVMVKSLKDIKSILELMKSRFPHIEPEFNVFRISKIENTVWDFLVPVNASEDFVKTLYE